MKIRSSLSVGVLAALCAVTLVACGSASKSSSGARSTGTTGSAGTAGSATTVAAPATRVWPTACTLVTASDVTAELGTPPDAPSVNTAGNCAYSSSTMPNYVNVIVSQAPNTSLFTQDATSGGATVLIPGLGDTAFKTPPTGSGCSVFVLEGDQFLRIDYFVPANAPKCANVEQLARTAIGRVPR